MNWKQEFLERHNFEPIKVTLEDHNYGKLVILPNGKILDYFGGPTRCYPEFTYAMNYLPKYYSHTVYLSGELTDELRLHQFEFCEKRIAYGYFNNPLIGYVYGAPININESNYKDKDVLMDTFKHSYPRSQFSSYVDMRFRFTNMPVTLELYQWMLTHIGPRNVEWKTPYMAESILIRRKANAVKFKLAWG